MTNSADVGSMIGRTAVDQDGNKIGKIGQVYLNGDTGYPQWVTVKTGLFGTKESFAPLHNARDEGGNVVLSVSKDLIKGAPSIEADEHLDDAQNATLYSHYAGHLGRDEDTADRGAHAADRAHSHAQDSHAQDGDAQDGDAQDGHAHDGRAQHDPAQHEAGEAVQDGGNVRAAAPPAGASDADDPSGAKPEDGMIRSQEQLKVGTVQHESGRARLRKYIVTEDVTITVPVSHQEVRVEREPVTDAERESAASGGAAGPGELSSGELTDQEHEIILYTERPVVRMETVPVERVRMSTETVTEDQQITEQVRREKIEVLDADGT